MFFDRVGKSITQEMFNQIILIIPTMHVVERATSFKRKLLKDII